MASILEDKSSIKQEQNVLRSIIWKLSAYSLMYVLICILSIKEIFWVVFNVSLFLCRMLIKQVLNNARIVHINHTFCILCLPISYKEDLSLNHYPICFPIPAQMWYLFTHAIIFSQKDCIINFDTSRGSLHCALNEVGMV